MDPSESAHWMWDFEAFILELEDNFGPHDPAGDAETALTNLSMKDLHHVTKYVVEFNKLAARIDWNEPALRDRFYRGLPLHLRTEVLKGGKPLTLAAMRRKAQECNQIHWMTRDEIARKPKSTPRPAPKDSDAKPPTSSSTNASKPSNTPRPSRPGNPAPPSAPSSSAPKPKPDLSNKLGKDGKLNSDERKRRMENNLCLYCGAGGHTAKDCRKASTARGCTANAPISTENSAHAVGWVDPSCAPTEIRLNVSALSASDSLVISLSCPLVPIPLTTLVDSVRSRSAYLMAPATPSSPALWRCLSPFRPAKLFP
ncbi:hypothetical protein AX17_006759 [Amanita inopinata Kibby_2008]|nr:hypothetical protein AX17_006759 [Amanita inopinata Kibby_2008]